jgi:VWFA-related protein
MTARQRTEAPSSSWALGLAPRATRKGKTPSPAISPIGAATEAPLTIAMVIEFSNKFQRLYGRTWYQTLELAWGFASTLKPQDYVAVIAYDIRPEILSDFTTDRSKTQEALHRLTIPAFSEANLFDALTDTADRMSGIEGRKAILAITSGIDTFSKITYSDARKLVQEAGVPIYIISTGNMFFKRYEQYLPPTDGLIGQPGRMTFLQAANQLRTFAKESGGQLFEMTFEGEINSYVQSINALLRSQYSLAYDLDQPHTAGKRYKIEVKVDVDGDGVYDDKQYVVQNRTFYIAPGPPKMAK